MLLTLLEDLQVEVILGNFLWGINPDPRRNSLNRVLQVAWLLRDTTFRYYEWISFSLRSTFKIDKIRLCHTTHPNPVSLNILVECLILICAYLLHLHCIFLLKLFCSKYSSGTIFSIKFICWFKQVQISFYEVVVPLFASDSFFSMMDVCHY